MKLKMRVTAKNGHVGVTTVELPRLDIQVAVKKAALAIGLDMANVREARIMPN